MAGYSGTPLPKKLGIKDGHTVATLNEPDGFGTSLGALPVDASVVHDLRGHRDVVVAFFTERIAFEKRLAAMTKAIFPDGGLWIAWPKKASKVPTDITEDVVRAVALPTGLVDNKVCAIDDVWSGLRLVVRVENRK
ncbi:MAG: DUF3052 domain-containing protein [Acidimicrobiales bacterium]